MIPTPLPALVEHLIRQYGLESVRALARLLELEGDDQRKLYATLKPNARGSYAMTIALLDKAGFLTPTGRDFLQVERPISDEEEAARARAAADSLAALLRERQKRERAEPRRAAG